VQGVKVLNGRFTLWSAQQNCPLLCLSVDSTSYDDGALKLGFESLAEVCSDGREEIALAYVDNPHRDEKGIIRRIPSLARPR
jgi:hypothetical protein